MYNKLHILKVHSFKILTYIHIHEIYIHHNQDKEHILLPAKEYLCFFVVPPSYRRQPLICFLSLHVSLHLLKFYKYSICSFFGLCNSTVLSSVSIHSFRYWVVIHCMDVSLFIHPPVDGYLDCFGYLVVFARYK